MRLLLNLRALHRALAITLAAVLLGGLLACAGGGRPAPAGGHAIDPAAGPTSAGYPAPSLSITTATSGARLVAEIRADHAAALYQLACRLSYDPLAVRPLTVARGALADQRAIFFSTITAPAYVPVAFTYHPGEAIPAAQGAVAQIEFEVLDPSRPPALGIIRTADYLIANGADGQPLDLRVEVAP